MKVLERIPLPFIFYILFLTEITGKNMHAALKVKKGGEVIDSAISHVPQIQSVKGVGVVINLVELNDQVK